jgi:dihydroorotase
MEGKDKMEMKEIIATYPDGITVNAFDMVGSGEDAYPVFTFQEEPTKFCFGGAVFKSIVQAWVSNFEGSVSDASAALAATGGVKMIFEHTVTKQGRSLTNVKIPD